MNFNKLLAEKEKSKLVENAKNIELSDKKLEYVYKRIQSFSEMSFSDFKSYVELRISEKDPLAIYTFMKNPSKQNIYEPLQLDIMEKYLGIKIKRHNKDSFDDFKTKTFDGISEDGLSIFQCKYIKESGGSQDNQFNDLIRFNHEHEYDANYLVISGEYGIWKMREYLKTNKLAKNTFVAILNDDVDILNGNEELDNTRHFSNDSILVKHFISFPMSNIIEPFVGEGDLLKVLKIPFESVKCYDITQPKTHFPNFTLKDTLESNVIEDNSYVITNPPYLAKNKLSKELKDKYKKYTFQDLYQILIQQIISSKAQGGILILPINFLIGKQTEGLRKEFMKKFYIQIANIYEFQVFENTTQAICSIQFLNTYTCTCHPTKVYIFESRDVIHEVSHSVLNKNIFSEYPLNDNSIQISRFYNTSLKPTKIRICLLDNKLSKIHAQVLDEFPTTEDKLTDRAFMTICCNVEIKDCEAIAKRFNDTLNEFRQNTYSLSLSSYREFNRKRLTFEEAIHLMKYVLSKSL